MWAPFSLLGGVVVALSLHVPAAAGADFAGGGNPLDKEEGTVESRVRSFYEEAIPNKVGTLSKIFFRYKGREEQLLADVRGKYGGKTLETIQKEAQEEQVAAEMEEQPGEWMEKDGWSIDGGTEGEEVEEELEEEDLQVLNDAGTQEEVKEEEVADDTQFKNGGNPLDKEEGTVESRVRSFYEEAIPNKVGTLSKIFFRYKGREEQLLADVREKYGGKTLGQINMQRRKEEKKKAKEEAAAKAANEITDELEMNEDEETTEMDEELLDGPSEDASTWWGNEQDKHNDPDAQSEEEFMMDQFYALVDGIVEKYEDRADELSETMMKAYPETDWSKSKMREGDEKEEDGLDIFQAKINGEYLHVPVHTFMAALCTIGCCCCCCCC